MTSIDSGVVKRMSGCSRLICNRSVADVSPCQVEQDLPTSVALLQTDLQIIEQCPNGTNIKQIPRQFSLIILERIDSIAASVFPPAVGAITKTCSPRRTTGITSSCKGLSSPPTKTVNDMVLQSRMEELKCTHRKGLTPVERDIIYIHGASRVAFGCR